MARLRTTLAVLALVVLAACSADGDDDSATAGATSAEETAGSEAGGDVATAGGDGDGAGTAVGDTASLVQFGRSVIRTAELSIVVEDVAAAATDAVRIAESHGGFQASGSVTLDAEHPTGEVVLRVPAPAFGGTLAALADLGEVADQQVGSEDVTGTVVDLEARVAAAEASVERVRGFLDRTGNVTELAGVERELLTRESELEALRGQLAAIRDHVDLATITARFGVDEEAPPELASSDPKPSDDIPAPTRALEHGWVVVVNVVKAGAAAVAFAAPLALLVIPAVIGWRFVQRRARRLAG